jgi:ATP-dependent Clp protease protease subunit
MSDDTVKEEEGEKPEAPTPPPPETRVMGLFQEVNESKAEEIIYALKLYQLESNEDIEFYISSPGGTASDMFAIYDFMRLVRESTDISTCGLGKVMSAAVLLMAGGTKGKRKIGKNCRIMIHSIIAGSSGAMNDLKNEMKEIQAIQELYVSCLCRETKLTKKKIKELFSQNVNIYLSAEEAVEYGIADIII